MAPLLNSMDPIYSANSLISQSTSVPPPSSNKKSSDEKKTTPPKPNTNIAEFNTLYEQLKKEANDGRELIGDDPFLQTKSIDKINEFLRRFPDTKANPNYNEDDVKPWTELSVNKLFKKTIQTLIDIINDLADIISASESTDSTTTRRNIMNAFFQKDRRLYVGFIFIFLSFILYFIDSV